MAFIEEKITSEEDLAIFNSFNFINPVYDEPAKPNYWIIDRERNAFLLCVGGALKYLNFMHLSGIIMLLHSVSIFI